MPTVAIPVIVAAKTLTVPFAYSEPFPRLFGSLSLPLFSSFTQLFVDLFYIPKIRIYISLSVDRQS